MSESTAAVRVRVPEPVEVSARTESGQRVKSKYPMSDWVETIADSYPALSGSPRNARRADRLIRAFRTAEEAEGDARVAELEAASHEDLLAFLKKPSYQSGREVVERSPFHPAVERAALPFVDAVENPLPRKAAEKGEPAAPAVPGGNGAAPRTRRARSAGPTPERE